MLTLILPTKQHNLMKAALRKAGQREVGGILMGENIGNNVFIVREITIHRHGTFASFINVLRMLLVGSVPFLKKLATIMYASIISVNGTHTLHLSHIQAEKTICLCTDRKG